MIWLKTAWDFLTSPIGKVLIAVVLLLGALWLHSGWVQDAYNAADKAGYARAQEENRAVNDKLRKELDDEKQKARDAGLAASKQLEQVRAELRAATDDAAEEARDAAPKDPVCAPSERTIRVWNDAVDRANAAAGAGP